MIFFQERDAALRRRNHLRNIGSLWSLGALYDIELDIFSFFQGFESFPLESGVMDKHILSAIKPDKSKAFSIIEPLHRTFCLHKTLLSSTAT